MSNLKKFNIFVFSSTFSKLMIEVFIPILLFNSGFSLKYILLFFLTKFITIFFVTFLGGYLGKKIKFKNLMIISNILFCVSCIMVNYLKTNLYYLIFLAIVNGTYSIFYWISRHVYALNIIENKKTTESVSSFTIFSLIASLPATFIGAIIIKHFGFIVLCIIVLILSLLSTIPLFLIKEKSEKENINLREVSKNYPKKNYLFTLLYQIQVVCIGLFPLYIYLTVKSSLEYLGVVNIICGISSIIYIYLLAKKMDKNKKDYLGFSAICLAVLWVLKLNIHASILFLVVVFIEGVFASGLETVVSRDIYCLGNSQNYLSYILFVEIINTIFRSVFLVFVLFFNIPLKMILYIGIIALILISFVKFDDGKLGY